METKDVIIGLLLVALVLALNQTPKAAGETVVLRTTLTSGTFNGASYTGSYLAVDKNADAALECYKYASQLSGTCTCTTPFVSTKDNYPICAKSFLGSSGATVNGVVVCTASNAGRYYEPSSSCATGFTQSNPLSPYSTNGQEVYATGSCTPDCSCATNACSTTTCSNGCGGTCQGTKVCTDTCFQTFITNANAWMSCTQ